MTVNPLSQELLQCPIRPNIVYYIARKEGFFKHGTLPQRLHNPGALVFRRQKGATKGERGFAKFKSDSIGWAALELDLLYKIRKGIPLHIGWDYL